MYDFLSLIACRTQIFRIDIGCQGRHPECFCAIRVYNATCIVMYLYAEYIYIYIHWFCIPLAEDDGLWKME